MSFEIAAILLAWAAILLLSLTMSGLVRQIHQLTDGKALAPQRTSVGPVPGTRMAVETMGGSAARTIALLFLAPDCASCHAVLAWLREADFSLFDADVRVLLPGSLPGTPMPGVHVIEGAMASFERHGVVTTPFLVLTNGTGIVQRTFLLEDASQFEELLRRGMKEPV